MCYCRKYSSRACLLIDTADAPILCFGEQEKKPANVMKVLPAANGVTSPPTSMDEAWQTADPYSFFPKPSDNNKARTMRLQQSC